MARWWQRVALCLSWSGLTTLAFAQGPPAGDIPLPGVAAVDAAATNPANNNPPAAPAPSTGEGNSTPTAPPDGTQPFQGGVVVPPFMATPGPPTAPVVGTPTTSGAGPQNAFTDNNLPSIPPTRFHADFEYLQLWLQKAPVPILVTTGSLADAVPGALGELHTKTLLDEVSGGSFSRSGGRLTLGYDLDDLKILTVTANYFLTEQGDPTQAVSSNSSGIPVLTRPFFNVAQQSNDADPIALPNIMKGRFAVSEPNKLQGGELNLHYNFFASGLIDSRWSLLGGFRYLQLDEGLNISETSTDIPGLGSPGNVYNLRESFTTRNRFYGGQFGAQWETHLGPFSLALIGTCSVGQVDQTVTIGSFTSIRGADGSFVSGQNTALLVGPGNAGQFSRKRITAIPEGELKVSYAFNENVSVSLGYMFLYLTNMVRPGNQTPSGVNVQSVPAVPTPPLIPGPPGLATSNVAVQGLTAGLQISY